MYVCVCVCVGVWCVCVCVCVFVFILMQYTVNAITVFDYLPISLGIVKHVHLATACS